MRIEAREIAAGERDERIEVHVNSCIRNLNRVRRERQRIELGVTRPRKSGGTQTGRSRAVTQKTYIGLRRLACVSLTNCSLHYILYSSSGQTSAPAVSGCEL